MKLLVLKWKGARERDKQEKNRGGKRKKGREVLLTSNRSCCLCRKKIYRLRSFWKVGKGERREGAICMVEGGD